VRPNKPSPPASTRDRTATLAAATLILIAGLAAYANSFAGVFVFDDEPALVQNTHLQSVWPLTTAMAAPPGTTLSGRPVAALSFAIDRALSDDGSPSAYHATNLAIHLAAALLVFGITRRTLLTPALRDRFGHAATTLAAIVALVFVAHPLQTGSVTYIVQRVESLMGLFYLATLYCAIRALEGRDRGGSRAAPALWSSASVVACALGMGTKEVMVTAPLIVILWDYLFARDRSAGRKPLYAGLVATWSILAVLVAGGHRSSAVGFGFAEWPWWRYLMTQAQVVTHYLRLAIVPTPLVLDYEWPAATALAQVALPAVFLSALIASTAWGLVRRAPAAFAGAWFFLILAPSSSVLPIVTEVAAEHRMYLPVAGVVALAVLALFSTTRRVPKWAGLLAASAAVILFARMTYQRNADYADFDRIWSQTIAERPRNARARNNYATSLIMKGRHAEAEPHLRIAVAERPSAEAEANLGVALSAQGRLDEGVVHLRRAIELRPDYAPAHRNLGETYALQHRLADALTHYAKALEQHPDDVNLLNRISWIQATASDARIRDGSRALAFAERAVTLTRRQDPDALDSLAAALAELGEFEKAAATAREAVGVATARGNRSLSRGLEQRLALYARGQRYRER
jgi:tetratricopeptide (TPR) repeat protein